jgi:CubicO group peptidase (beta-lactamase class C family)
MQRREFLTGALSAPILAAAWKQGVPPAFENEILESMAVAPVPGAVIGIIRNGNPVSNRPLGFRNMETRAPVTSNTIFQAASLSKQAAVYAAFALRDAGKLDFDRTLVFYVDDLPDPRARKVTVRHVLSHSSGFPNWRFSPTALLAPEFEPGSAFQYSGEGFFYLQRILEQVSGLGYCELIDRLVFHPLAMTSSSMIWKPEFTDRYALPHGRRGEVRSNWDARPKRLYEIAEQKGQNVARWRYAEYESAAREAGVTPIPDNLLPNAAASMITTGPDYARFLKAALRNPEIRREQTRIRPTLGWGLGWGIERAAGREYLWQWGANGGYKNFVVA